jgi:hypothetical protein
MRGFRQALLWAATDSQLLMPNGPNTAGGDLRKRALEFYAKAKAIRHSKSMHESMALLPSPRKPPSAPGNWHFNGHSLSFCF